MNKGDLVNEVAKVVNTKREAQEAVDCIFSTITQALKKKGTVTLVGFGTFKVSKRKARTGRNPQTGATIKIAAKKVPRCKNKAYFINSSISKSSLKKFNLAKTRIPSELTGSHSKTP